jgi:hypothetical protein
VLNLPSTASAATLSPNGSALVPDLAITGNKTLLSIGALRNTGLSAVGVSRAKRKRARRGHDHGEHNSLGVWVEKRRYFFFGGRISSRDGPTVSAALAPRPPIGFSGPSVVSRLV